MSVSKDWKPAYQESFFILPHWQPWFKNVLVSIRQCVLFSHSSQRGFLQILLGGRGSGSAVHAHTALEAQPVGHGKGWLSCFLCLVWVMVESMESMLSLLGSEEGGVSFFCTFPVAAPTSALASSHAWLLVTTRVCLKKRSCVRRFDSLRSSLLHIVPKVDGTGDFLTRAVSVPLPSKVKVVADFPHWIQHLKSALVNATLSTHPAPQAAIFF